MSGNFVLFLVCILIIYSVWLYFRFNKHIALEILITGALITVIGWINIPNFFVLDSKLISDDIRFLPYKFANKYNIFYIIISSTVLVSLIEAMKVLQKITFSSEISTRKINKKYDNFVKDAVELYVIGSDLDFLKDNKDQFNKFKQLRSNCKILCTSNSIGNNLKSKYKELLDSDVDIRRIDSSTSQNSFSKLRGHIKIDSTGRTKCLFVEKTLEGSKYNKIEITNGFIIQSLKEEFISMHSESVNPLIKYIALDLGGVYFNGDFNNDFVNVINKKLNLDVKTTSQDTVILDEELNLGKIDIVKVWEKRTNKTFKKEDKKLIKDTWKSVWEPNKEMKQLVKLLVDKGYKVYPFGNIDKENGEHYKVNGYFNNFNGESFMSYERLCNKDILLPNEEFYKAFTEYRQINNLEVLLIDDEKKDIEEAIKCGWSVIEFNIKDGVNPLINELVDKRILNKKDRDQFTTEKQPLATAPS
ncbi:MAG: hypothetical protein N4A48_00665 [Tepidibacter sp.]|jgi:FMN phosphatase YigB (HAD superfamily)|uniref:hypothetical protein n=1 Tax=Tepidibacter sp. TaxID=2529387 RepID=UPI0025F7DC55|nr:hypothetical protein [Tepidibacter sp.]MCT4507270.1 hypothetical protein [Tepidibacter sp.]